MVHLICLRCNRPNVAEAKFCIECGAGLLRKFCGVCHAVNDSESHFCQSCGASLPAQPSVPPPAPVPHADSIPSLTDVAFLEPEGGPPGSLILAPAIEGGAVVELSPQFPVLASHLSRAAVPPVVKTYRAPILLGVGGAAVLVIAILLWPRSDFRVGLSESGAAREPLAGISGKGAAAIGAAALPGFSDAAVLPALPLPMASDPGRGDVASSPLETLGNAKEPEKAARRTPAEVIGAVRSPLAGVPAAAPERARVAKTPPRPSAPAPECTPEVDALGLCAPGAKVKGR